MLILRGRATSPLWNQFFSCSGQRKAGPALSGSAKCGAGSAQPSDVNRNGSYGPCGNMGHEDQHRPWLWQDHGPNTALGSSWGPDITVAPGGSPGHSDQHCRRVSVALRDQDGPRLRPKPWACTQPLVVTGVMDTNTGPVCCRVTDQT